MRLDEFSNLNELNRPNTRGLAGNFLKTRGYEKLGKGAYASVWAKPGEDSIVKIFDNDDSAYQQYISLIQRNKNEHFPVLKGKMMKVNDKYSAVRMEKLTPITDSQYVSIGLAPVYKYLNYVDYPERLNDDEVKKLLSEIDILEKNQPGIKQALDLIGENFKYFDFHPQNVMMRGNTVVITDPVN